MLRRIAAKLPNALRQSTGNAALSLAIAAPAVLSGVGVATDFATFTMKRNELQAVADQAAISAANELVVGNTSATSVSATVDTYIAYAVKDSLRSVTAKTSLGANADSVTVDVMEPWTPFFAHFIGMKITPVSVSATASLVGESKICVLALESKNPGAIDMAREASIQANGCAVYSNSISSSGISLSDNSEIDSPQVCSAGGVQGKGLSSADKVMTDCPAIADPLASRPAPSIKGCDFKDLTISSGSVTLGPGIYCGGLRITGTAKVSFNPGTYVIKDDVFRVSNTADVKGQNVGFVLAGDKAVLSFTDDATIELSGAETGGLAGLLFYEDASGKTERQHIIRASRAHTLTGTIYLPRGNLRVDPNSAVGQNSAYTAIVVRSLSVDNGPRLVLNSNYGATKVPIPAGIKSSASIVLSE